MRFIGKERRKAENQAERKSFHCCTNSLSLLWPLNVLTSTSLTAEASSSGEMRALCFICDMRQPSFCKVHVKAMDFNTENCKLKKELKDQSRQTWEVTTKPTRWRSFLDKKNRFFSQVIFLQK